jgi:predicted DNA-binding transcriptional regulator YafY
MNRIDRLVALIILLQTKILIRGREIAGHFNVSLRTVYRDINAICEAGVPVAAEAGEGYSIMEGYHLPPIMFTTDEAAALFTGAMFSEYFTDESIKKHGISAITKIKSVLPNHTKNYLEKLQESMIMFSKPSRQDGFSKEVLAVIQDAIVNHFVLKIHYYAAWSNSWTERKIEPLGMAYYFNNWHIIAWCRLRGAIRDFRADRLKKINKSNEKFTPRDNSFIREYTNTLEKTDTFQKVTIKVPYYVALSLKERLFSGFEENVSDDKVILTFWSPAMDWLVPLLFAYGKDVEIITPKKLKELMARRTAEVARHYKNCL